MKLWHFVILNALGLLLIGCATLTTNEADRTWEHVGMAEGPDTTRKVDADGNPNFGPR